MQKLCRNQNWMSALYARTNECTESTHTTKSETTPHRHEMGKRTRTLSKKEEQPLLRLLTSPQDDNNNNNTEHTCCELSDRRQDGLCVCALYIMYQLHMIMMIACVGCKLCELSVLVGFGTIRVQAKVRK